VSLNTTSGAALQDGGRYGVGTVIVAHFDESITDRAAAAVRGSWYWVDNQNAHWRPERYFAPGTLVTAEANIYGVRLGDGLYGEEDSRA
jgi:hypothetical protein